MKTSYITLGILSIGVTAANVVILPKRLLPSVQLETVRKAQMVQMVRAAGTVEAKRSVQFKAEFDGPIVSKFFKEGDPVRAGQPLLTVGRDKIRMEYESKSNALENARADLAKARKDANVAKALYKRGAVAYANVEEAARSAVRAAQTLKTAQEDFRLQQDRWNKATVVAPFAGTVVKDSIGSEVSVTAGKDLVMVADVSEYSVVARVDEAEIGQIQKGQDAIVKLQAYNNTVMAAKVTNIGSQADDNGVPEIPVTLSLLSNLGMPIRPKMTGVVEIETGKFGVILSVPLSAISNTSGGSRVWTVDSLNRLRSKPVVLGQRSNPVRVEVVQGLSEGQRVCLKPDPAWVDGLKVRVGGLSDGKP